MNCPDLAFEGVAVVLRLSPLSLFVSGFAGVLVFSSALRAQSALPRNVPRSACAQAMEKRPANAGTSQGGAQAIAPHRFLDRTNLALFAGVAAVRALDFTSTEHFRERGVNEALLSNSIVDNKPLFAGIELAATAASMGVSYLFHHTGHHRLERWVSIFHIGAGTFGDIRNYTLGNSAGTAPGY